jgi:hypothetical protein
VTLVLLDTNAYLRLAIRVKPMLGVKFGQKDYVLTILKDVEDEVHRNPRLQFKFPWFDDQQIAGERMATRVRLNERERKGLEVAASVFRGHVLINAENYKTPPSNTDCRVLAFGQIRSAIVVTDDLSMHQLASEFSINDVWHGHELLRRMLTAKMISNDQVREIFEALEVNNDLPASWKKAKHTEFVKLFGKAPSS